MRAANRALFFLAAACAAAGCGSRPSAVGEWSQINPADGSVLGNRMEIKGDGTWSMTGFPPLEGTYKLDDGKVRMRIEKVDGKDRATAIKEATGGVDVEQQLNDLDKQLVFKVIEEDGKTVLDQTGPNTIYKGGLRFRKVEKD